MNEKYNVYLVSDSTGETLDRIFLSIKSQFSNFDYDKKEFVFVRTNNQIDKIIDECKLRKNAIILYTIVETKFAKYISSEAQKNNIPCFGILGSLILNQKAIHKPSAQHVLDENYYKRIEAIQYTMTHDDGNRTNEFQETDIILLGVSRTSKTPTSIYLANRGYKTMNIPLVQNQGIPQDIIKNNLNKCIIGLIADPQRLSEIRRNRVALMKDNVPSYADVENIKKEVKESLSLFKKNGWPIIDVTRKSVEETAASIIKIYDIKNQK